MTTTITTHTGEHLTAAELCERTALVIQERGFFQGWFVPPKYAPHDDFYEATAGAVESAEDVTRDENDDITEYKLGEDRYVMDDSGYYNGPHLTFEDELTEARKTCPVCAMGALNTVLSGDPADQTWVPLSFHQPGVGYSAGEVMDSVFDTFADVVGNTVHRAPGHATSGVFAAYNDSHTADEVIAALRHTRDRLLSR